MELVNASLPHPFYILQSLSDWAIIMLFKINPKIVHIQLLHYKARKYFFNISWWTAATLFKKIFNSNTCFLKYFDYS